MIVNKGFEHVKCEFKKRLWLTDCSCKVFKRIYGPSVGIFVDESPKHVKKILQKAEYEIRYGIFHGRSDILQVYPYVYSDIFEDITVLQLIKFGAVWARFPEATKATEKITADIELEVSHVYLSGFKVSVICYIKQFRVKESKFVSAFDYLETCFEKKQKKA